MKRSGQIFLLALIVGAALALRLWNIDFRGLSHPEIYAPGIDLVAGISEPPPRHFLRETLWWHFHDEPHPMGYYLAMFGWVKLFGASEFSLRLPSALLGTFSVLAIYSVGSRAFGRTVGMLAAVLLAFNGFHIFWSQIGRMYVPGAFLGLISTLILIELSHTQRRRPGWEIAYVVAAVAGVQTLELFWPFLLVHAGWIAALYMRQEALVKPPLTSRMLWHGTRISQVLSMSLAVAAPGLLHSVYRARSGAVEGPTLRFLQEYFSFGFLFAEDMSGQPYLLPSVYVAVLALVSCVFLLLFSVRARTETHPTDLTNRPIPSWIRIGTSIAVMVFMIWLASIAHRRRAYLAAMAILPLLSLAVPALTEMASRLLGKVRFLNRISPLVLLFILLAVAAPIMLFLASFKVSVLAPRAFLIFVPYMLILCAAGLVSLPVSQNLRIALSVGLIALFFFSIPYSYRKPGSPRDYKVLAQNVRKTMRPDDLIFVRDRNWEDTPIFYYLPDGTYVVTDFASALNNNPEKRVWLVTWPWEKQPTINDERREALGAYKLIEKVDVRRGRAELFIRSGKGQ